MPPCVSALILCVRADDGISISVGGYSDKLFLLLKQVCIVSSAKEIQNTQQPNKFAAATSPTTEHVVKASSTRNESDVGWNSNMECCSAHGSLVPQLRWNAHVCKQKDDPDDAHDNTMYVTDHRAARHVSVGECAVLMGGSQ